MADTTALKNRIRAAIKANDNQEITGPVLQQALLDMVDELNGATETEASQRQNGDSTLQQGINTERQARIDADAALGQRITDEIQQEQSTRQSGINAEALERKKGDSRDIYFTNATAPRFSIANNTLTIVLPQNETMRLYNPYSGTEVEVNLSQQETTTFSLVTLRRLVYNFTQNTLSVEQTSAAHPQGNYVVLMSVFGSPENLGSIDGLLRGYYIAYMRSTLAGEVSRVENKSDKFNSLELVDVTGTDVKDTNMSLALRKNDGSEQDPDIVTLDTINISSASQEKAGLLPAINTWDSKPTYGNKKPISSEAISENIVNGFFSGKNNDYSYFRFKSVIPNSRYIVIIDKDNISHQNVTATGVFGFAVSSRDTNNVETRLVNFQTTAYNSIPRYVIVTVPSDSICLEIGGRADIGTEVHFAILSYSAIYLQKHVYFTDAAVPVFTVSATTLNVVLPENKVMRIYGPNGLEKEVDLSQQQTLSFNIQTMQKLAYNYKTNNIGVVSITQNYEDGTIVDLLVVNGTARTGAVTGLLAGYYYNQLARASETNVDYLLNHDAEIYGIDISTNLLNGTPNNYNNTYAVRSNRIPVEGFVPYEVFTTRPVSAEGNYYSYSVMLRDKNGNILLNIQIPRTDLKKCTTIENTAYVEFGIFELDSNGDYVTLRTTDFEGYDTYIKTNSVRKCLSDDKSGIESLSKLQNDIVDTINGLVKNYDVSISTNSQQAIQYCFLKGKTYIIEKLAGCSSGFGSLYLSKDGTINASVDNRIQTLDATGFVNNKLTFTAIDDALGLNGYWTAGSLKLKIYEADGSMEDIRTKLLSEANVTIGFGYNTVGTRIALAGCMSTDTMFAVPSSVTRVIWRCGNLQPDHNKACIIAYDSNRDRITSRYYTANNSERTIDLPEGCAYLKASFKVDTNGAGVYQTDGTPIFVANPINGAYPQSIKNAEKIAELNNTNGGFVYFTDAKWPSFVTNSSSLIVTFPEGENEYMRIYSNNGTVLEYNLNNLASREFTLNSLKKLVYDWDNNTISVVQIDAIGNFFVLISLGGSPINHGAIDGALRGYYIAWLKTRLEVLENKEEKTNPDEIAAIGNIQKWADFKFLFFSDVHAGWTNVQRVVDYAENLGASKCDCIINGGDTVLNRITDRLDQYNDIIEESSIPVLSVPGNHDCWTGSNWNWADQKDIYNLVTAEVASTVPTIVQPANAATEGLNYYYKDFGMVRVICLTAMQNGSDNLYFDIAQQNWLTDVLESARNRLYYFKATAYGIEDYTLQEGDIVSKVYTHFADMNADTRNIVTGNIYAVRTGVIIVTHAPFALSDRVEISAKLNSWCNSSINPTRSKGIAEDGLKVNEAALSIVDTYIENGGAFICWLTGHRHLDTVIKHGTYTGQFMINITTANANRHNDSYGTVDINDANYDAFDYIGIDMRSSMIKVLRVGLAQDSSMRIRRSWCYDYANKVLMSEN